MLAILVLSASPTRAVDALSPAEADRRAALSPLERARELEENFHFQEAFDAYDRLRMRPGSPGDIADAEIGAAKCLHRWAGLQLSLRPYRGLERNPGEREAPPDDSLARLEAAAGKWAGTSQEPKVLLALARRESDQKPFDVPSLPKRIREHRERALAGYERIAFTGQSSLSEKIEAELGAASCLSELGRRDDARSRLERAAERFRGSKERPRILLALGPYLNDERRLELYRTVASESAGTPSGAEATYRQAYVLENLDREAEALRICEDVASRYTGTVWAAHALARLGLHYLEREDRERAKLYYRKLAEYPPDWSDVETHKNSVEDLDRYVLSPFYDKVKYRLERILMAVFHLDSFDPRTVILSSALTPYVCRLGALLICLVLLLPGSRVAPPATSSTPLLRRHWTVAGAVFFLTSFWTAEVVLVVASSLSVNALFLFSWTWDLASTIVTGSVILLIVLWKEHFGRVLGISVRSVRRAALLFAGGLLLTLAAWACVVVVYSWLIRTGHAAYATRAGPTGLSSEHSWALAVPYYVFLALVEEAVFRGALHQALKTRVAPWLAAILGSLLFSQFHLYAFWSSVSVFAAGLVLVWIVERTGSLAPGTLLHAGCNLLLFALKRAR